MALSSSALPRQRAAQPQARRASLQPVPRALRQRLAPSAVLLLQRRCSLPLGAGAPRLAPAPQRVVHAGAASDSATATAAPPAPQLLQGVREALDAYNQAPPSQVRGSLRGSGARLGAHESCGVGVPQRAGAPHTQRAQKFEFSADVLAAMLAAKEGGVLRKFGVAQPKRRSVLQNELRQVSVAVCAPGQSGSNAHEAQHVFTPLGLVGGCRGPAPRRSAPGHSARWWRVVLARPSQVGIKNPGMIATPSVRNDAAFITAVVRECAAALPVRIISVRARCGLPRHEIPTHGVRAPCGWLAARSEHQLAGGGGGRHAAGRLGLLLLLPHR